MPACVSLIQLGTPTPCFVIPFTCLQALRRAVQRPGAGGVCRPQKDGCAPRLLNPHRPLSASRPLSPHRLLSRLLLAQRVSSAAPWRTGRFALPKGAPLPTLPHLLRL